MQKSTKTGITIIIAISLVAIVAYSVPQALKGLQTQVIYQYGYDVSRTPVGGTTPITSRVFIRITASGTQLGPIKDVPTTYYVSVLNSGTTPVSLYGTEFVLATGPDAQNPLLLMSPPVTPSRVDRYLVHTFNAFDFEGAEYVNNTSSIKFAGLNLNAQGTSTPTVLNPGIEQPLFSFTGAYAESGAREFQIVVGKAYFQPLTLANPSSIGSGFNETPELNVSGAEVSFLVRATEFDLSGSSNSPDGRVNSSDVRKLFENWNP